ncbi:MAG: pullulanase-type alpha-1,6-glucosidase, partial [Anaerolineales bacterium]|nr:pullulanase-type alpha-1,6-glucosidase [Anaerolineales bacterium]
ILHRGDQKDPLEDQKIALSGSSAEVWIVEGIPGGFNSEEQAIQSAAESRFGKSLQSARAHWLSLETIAWPSSPDGGTCYLVYSESGEVAESLAGFGETNLIRLREQGKIPEDLAERYPHLANYVNLQIEELEPGLAGQILKGQSCVIVERDGQITAASSLQIPGILDELFTYDGLLGLDLTGEVPRIRLWAPTARCVRLLLQKSGVSGTDDVTLDLPMAFDPVSGVWEARGEADWIGGAYLFDVEVFDRAAGKFIKNQVADPYALCLTANSASALIVNLATPDLAPPGWEQQNKPGLEHPTDSILYELHIRDFSASDSTVSPDHRGGYLAFAEEESDGMRHLRRLARAGVTHLHLLPVIDFGSVNEDKSTWAMPDPEQLAEYPPDSQAQQELVRHTKDKDGFNWGYDPLHPLAPEGSYASDPDSPLQIREARQMVAGINQAGLRVVLDVVFNHFYAPTPHIPSYFDKIVPGYYHRLDEYGELMESTCCPDSATEHAMVEKLMVDAIKHWATAYKIDGFRFDLMGHHLVRTRTRIRQELDKLTHENAGVNGREILLYGEGWDFGGLAGNARGRNASQANIGGTGIGAFNDRIRDAVRGGGGLGGYRSPGFAFGRYDSPDQAYAAYVKDLLKLSMAGNLIGFPGLGHITYGLSQAAFAHQPAETIQYISAHDNETWFDAVQIKANDNLSLEDRLRIHRLGISILCLSQGIPFFHAAVELLRSKSLDRNSYNSGDWFNRLDWTYQSNNWGIGLPIWEENAANWPLMKALLANAAIRPGPAEILGTLAHFEEMLQVRRSSPLFRLRTADEIKNQLSYLDNGEENADFLTILRIADREIDPIDPQFQSLLVVINADSERRAIPCPVSLNSSSAYELHPVLARSQDTKLASARYIKEEDLFEVPGRSAVVFVEPR